MNHDNLFRPKKMSDFTYKKITKRNLYSIIFE